VFDEIPERSFHPTLGVIVFNKRWTISLSGKAIREQTLCMKITRGLVRRGVGVSLDLNLQVPLKIGRPGD